MTRARKGEKFSDLARQQFRRPGNRPQRRSRCRPTSAASCSSRSKTSSSRQEAKGYVTDPFKRPQGFVILRIEERYAAGQASFDEVKEQIRKSWRCPDAAESTHYPDQAARGGLSRDTKDGYTDSGAAPGKDTSWKEIAQLKPQTITKEEVAAAHAPPQEVAVMPIPFTGRHGEDLPPRHVAGINIRAATPRTASSDGSGARAKPSGEQ